MKLSVRHQVFLILLAALFGLGGCGGGGSSGGSANPVTPPVIPPSGPPAIALNQVFASVSFQGLVSLQQAPGDSSRWFAVERGGRVWQFANDDNVSSSSLFIDISSRVESSPGEAGLLGMAFHPDWGAGTNDSVMLSYTRSGSPLVSYLSRFYSIDNTATLDDSNEEVIMTVLQDSTNHNGGNIVFGPDGYLYAGWGDGGGAGDPRDRGQDTNNLLGTITRIDVDGGTPYAIPVDNPFSANANCNQGFGAAPCAEIFAWGFRNPWRWSFDRMSGQLWVGDVGQNAIEEVDRVLLGENYGWRCREGATTFDNSGSCPSGLINPVTQYDHSLGQSITGGFVYRGTAIPALQGFYLFADFASGRIFAVAADAAIGSQAEALLDTSVSISSFAEDNDGELYVLDFGGQIYRLIEN